MSPRAKRPSSDDVDLLASFASGLYQELDKLSKKFPSAPLSDLATKRANRAIRDAKQLLGAHDKYAADLEIFVEAGQNPEVRDGVLVLKEILQAIERVQSKFEDDWRY